MIAQMNVTPIQQRQTYPTCKKCKHILHLRVPRGPLVKVFLFWLPLKKYFCTNCLRNRYIVVKNR
jgi:hypothetical protein